MPPKKPTPGPEKRALKSLAVRLDHDRWLRLREYALHDGRPVQQILVDLIDGLLDPAKRKV